MASSAMPRLVPPSEQLAERLIPYANLGFRTAISEQPAPYDVESLERFIREVKPMVDAGAD